MKNVNQMVSELIEAKNQGVEFVSYGGGGLGMAIEIDSAIADIKNMDDEMIGEGTWYACDEHGEEI